MVDCPERSRISLEISRAIRAEIGARKRASADPVQGMSTLRTARENLRRLRVEYRAHLAEHGCLPEGGAKLAADAAG